MKMLKKILPYYLKFGLPPMVITYLLIIIMRYNKGAYRGFLELFLIVFIGAIVPTIVAMYTFPKKENSKK